MPGVAACEVARSVRPGACCFLMAQDSLPLQATWRPARLSWRRRRAYKRKVLPQPVRFEVWVRSEGRCAICNRHRVDGALANKTIRLGELAHIVGQQNTAGSPRGKTISSSATP